MNLPSNSVTLNSSSDTSNINFFNEINEWTRDTTFTGTLFEDFYKDYIQNIFSTKRRLTKITASLPLTTFLNIELNDRLVYNGQIYKINSIQTNLQTGVSKIELLNVV